jgi:hypothetical protein
VGISSISYVMHGHTYIKDGVNVCGFRSINRTIQACNWYYKYVCEIWETSNCEAVIVCMSMKETYDLDLPRVCICTMKILKVIVLSWELIQSISMPVCIVGELYVVIFLSSQLKVSDFCLLWLLVAVTTLFGSGISCTSFERQWGMCI